MRADTVRSLGAVRWWKVAGLAGLAGVAATGVAVARDERRRQAYTPDEVRARLHARIGDGAPVGAEHGDSGPAAAADPEHVPGQALVEANARSSVGSSLRAALARSWRRAVGVIR
jgi:hypothetical protein